MNTVDLTPDPAPVTPIVTPVAIPVVTPIPPKPAPSLPVLVGVFLLATAINNLPAIWHAISAPARSVADAAAEVRQNTASIRQIGLALANYDATARFTAGRVDELEASADRHAATLKDHDAKIADVCEVATKNTADIASLAAKVDHPPTPPLPPGPPTPSLSSPLGAAIDAHSQAFPDDLDEIAGRIAPGQLTTANAIVAAFALKGAAAAGALKGVIAPRCDDKGNVTDYAGIKADLQAASQYLRSVKP